MAAWLYRRPGTKKWWLGFAVNGRQFLKSTGKEDKKEADKKLREVQFLEEARKDGKLTQEFVEALTGTKLARVTLHASIEDWLNECRGACAPSTVERYNTVAEDLKKFLDATETAPLLGEVSTEEIRSFLSARRAQASSSTVNLERKILSVFFIRALKQNLIRVNPVLQIKPFKKDKSEAEARRAFTIEELRLLHSKAPDDFWRYMNPGRVLLRPAAWRFDLPEMGQFCQPAQVSASRS